MRIYHPTIGEVWSKYRKLFEMDTVKQNRVRAWMNIWVGVRCGCDIIKNVKLLRAEIRMWRKMWTKALFVAFHHSWLWSSEEKRLRINSMGIKGLKLVVGTSAEMKSYPVDQAPLWECFHILGPEEQNRGGGGGRHGSAPLTHSLSLTHVWICLITLYAQGHTVWKLDVESWWCYFPLTLFKVKIMRK